MSRRPYIVGPVYDWVFFLGAPVLSLVAGMLVSGTWLADEERVLAGEHDSLAGFFIGTIIHAHLVAALFRSHNNPAIRRAHPIRFFLVPVALWLAITASAWLMVAATVVATFWDVWHSGAQTFGLARIYERNRGTPPELGRRLDYWLNQLLYAGPILAGVSLMDHVDSFLGFESVGDALFSSVPVAVAGIRPALTAAVLLVAAAFLACYAVYVRQLARRGHRPSPLKVWLVASTGAVSLAAWGFNSWGQAFLIMNLFHAVQYLALVWAAEGSRIAATLRLPRHPRLALTIYLGSVAAYGLGVEALDADLHTLWAVTIVVSLMHFWYDGFVWSVRRSQV